MLTGYPQPDQQPALRRLWQAAFGDEDDFLDLFFGLAYNPRRCRCITKENRVIAALYWFECHYSGQRLAYLYAVATDPEHRGKGLCRMLMEDTARLLRELGFQGCLLVPADTGLARMYEKMGYKVCSYVSQVTCPAAEEGIFLRKIDRAEYAQKRRAMLPEGGLTQEGEDLLLLSEMAEFFAGTEFLAAISRENGKLYCHELLGDIGCAPGIVKALEMEEGIFRYPGKDIPYAMWLPLTQDAQAPKYFGLALN